MTPSWQPSCSIEQLHLRAQLLARIRKFFAERHVLEVETPLLASSIGTDPQLAYFDTRHPSTNAARMMYLQTSPEFAMKRLLAAGSGCIYQICKAFRNEETGRYHNPEFTLLEWYRVGFNLDELMQEVEALCSCLLPGCGNAERLSYQQAFELYTGLDALEFSLEAYKHYAIKQQLDDAIRLCGSDHSLWLDFLFSHQVQPHLGRNNLTLIYAYPACQAALARLNSYDNRIAERVEIFWQGVELGNGYHELTDAHEQEQRFLCEQSYRTQHSLPAASIDQHLLSALRQGLPDCAGMAIGLDRLLMLIARVDNIANVLPFAFDRV